MRRFDYASPTTVDEASTILKRENAVVLAGGTDLIGALKAEIAPTAPDKVVSLKNIDGLNYIREEAGNLLIGATTPLDDIMDSDVVKKHWGAVADAARSVASPGIRSAATIAGNLCQDVRCWYYRYPHSIGGRIDCARKEGELCSAMMGQNKYHSIFGGISVGDTPCKKECPAGTDIPGYMEKLRAGDVDAAAEIILRVNPMPSITSRVCAHFCQEKCNREYYDERLNIGSVERYVGDHILEHADRFMKAPRKENGKSVAIIGSGPAGLAAAYYLRQSGYKVTIFERMEKPGGALMYAIPAFRLPKDIVKRFTDALEKMGIAFKLGTAVGEGKYALEELQKKHDSILLDTGTWKRPLIGISGEELTRFGLDFLVDVNNYMRERPGANVIVVGGGNVAVDVATTAKRLGAHKVTMICLEQRDEMPAGKEEVERVLAADIELLNGWGPNHVIKGGKGLRGVEFKACTSVLDANGHFAPQYDEKNTVSIDADVVFMAVGQIADLDFLEDVCKVETERGRVKVLDGNRTNVPGLFAGGDVTTGPATVIEAIAAGSSSARQINQYLDGEALVVEQDSACTSSCPGAPAFKTFNPDYRTMVKYHRPEEVPVEQQSIDREDIMGINYEEARAECERCLNCGCVAVNPSDMANMLIAMDAVVRTNMRSMPAGALFADVKISNVLKKGEIVLEIQIPKPAAGSVARYFKYRLRDSIDFAIAAVAWSCSMEDGKIADSRLVLGAAAPVPFRAKEAEQFLNGKKPDAETAKKAAELALKDALPLPNNAYKIDMFKAFIARTICPS